MLENQEDTQTEDTSKKGSRVEDTRQESNSQEGSILEVIKLGKTRPEGISQEGINQEGSQHYCAWEHREEVSVQLEEMLTQHLLK